MNNPLPGGRNTTTPNGVAHVAPGGNAGIVPELLTTKQAAELCGLGERTLWRYAHSGQAPAPIKIGDGRNAPIRFQRSLMMQWIAAGCPRVDGRAAG